MKVRNMEGKRGESQLLNYIKLRPSAGFFALSHSIFSKIAVDPFITHPTIPEDPEEL